VPYPVKDYGKFYTGDSYIVINVRKSFISYDLCTKIALIIFFKLVYVNELQT